MDKKDYLTSIKTTNDIKVGELNITLRGLREAAANSEKDLAFFKQQQVDIEEEIAQLGKDNVMLDEIIALLPDGD